ncbi:HNH endonuclease signature motif containing protein [Nocardioides renjunii]|uniref:HNH endonuclease signature motif containing protein n=1 Tax=Nocardioides renjunii TaxID=3095075 RepID=UPI002AFE070F|nr:HNH endonuclease signature motif containing protein [Nocardioides sp. S-34]WQQ20709.1 HNH endonuclease signature motif containing protein [Nocardioides sp. S-34]
MKGTATSVEAQATDLTDLTERALLSEAAEIEAVLREGEVHKLRIAYQWAVAHPALDSCETPEGPVLPSVLSEPETLGGAGTPAVAAFTSEPLAVALGCSPTSASSVLADALDLHHRLPLLWDQARALLVPVWKARRVASRTRHLSVDAARWVDRQVAGRSSSLGAAALDRLVAEAAARCDGEAQLDREAAARATWDVVLVHPDPHRCSGTSELRAIGDTLDLTRFNDVVCAEAEALGALGDTDELGVRKAKALGVIADAQARLDLTSLVDRGDLGARDQARREALARRGATVRLYLHASLSDVVTDEPTATGSGESLGPVTLDKIREWVGRSRVTVQPVLHVAADDRWSVDRHDPPPRMAEQVRLRDETCVFPWCGRSARQCDLDHREPFEDPGDGGPPGQTSPASLAPLCRRHHRAKTAGRWSYERTGPGSYLWTGPAGLTVLVTPRGTVRA